MTKEAPAVLESAIDFASSYPSALRGGYDEAMDSAGNLRASWNTVASSLFALGDAELQRRSASMDRRVRETGIAYDIFSHPNQPRQRWQLDLAPIVFSSQQWQSLETALIQRARLFDAMLRDFYGAQNLMRRGLVPPELIFADHSCLRPCQGILPAAGPLRFYAADLARDESGNWRIIDNHTETLAGIGFAIANRVVHTHITGDVFKRCNGIRLAQFFQNLQVALTEHAGRENARIALLTPGPHHEDYFSHAYLARYLGYLLVEGSDLRTKGNQVYLKTLEGLKEIDLIVRCVDGRLVDSLELDPAGAAGPAGLLRVNRANPRLIVNAVGSALVQNRGLGPYLGALARDILGEDLELPDAPRHWLGDPTARAHVLANLDNFVVRKAQEGTGRPGQAALGQDPRALSDVERDLLLREIELHGATLVAEEKRGFSSAPAFNNGSFESRPFAVRCFVARTGTSYEVMPGGLAMTVDANTAVALSTPDGHTRDVWILSDKEQRPHVSLWRPMLETARVERSQRVIQSRVADDLFWLGRYNERADWTMRVLRGTLRRIEEDNGPTGGLRSARKCLEALLGKDGRPPVSKGETNEHAIEQLCAALISSPKGSRALQRTFENLYRCANLARDRLSFETWQTLSKFRPQDTFSRGLAQAAPQAVLDYMDEGLASIAAFNGLMHENMTRNFGWSFLDMGRRIERAYNLAEAVRTLFIPGSDPEEEMNSLRFILELADSFITYRSRYRLDPSLPLVLDLLLLDETNPRSLAYQLTAITKHLEGLPDGARGAGLSEDRRLSLSALTAVRLADIEELAQEESRVGLDELLSGEIEIIPELSNAIGRHYFNLTDDAPHRVHTRSEPRPMIYDVSHRTLYRYSQTVVQSQHLVHVSPRAVPHQTIRSHSLMIEPAPAMRYDGLDAFSNPFAILDVEMPHKEFVIHARSTIEIAEPAPFDFARSTPWDRLDDVLYAPGAPIDLDVVQFRSPSRLTNANLELADYAAQSFTPGRPVLEGAFDLTRRIFKEFKFDPFATDVSTPITQVFKQRRGVCQDFAHLSLALLRAKRIPARYVSGYILTHPAPGQKRLEGADASHAWISVWAPETGWRDFDPTNGLAVGNEHITIAFGRDYNDVCPISGVLLGGGDHTVTVGVDVLPVKE